ncbi:MAG: 2OG-Fe(II) oxygenase, partial [Deltaproteobacteria bacterium]|nr:2OG-Fe(II) oxygenase [Deltaproteobacteria bacterium]
MDKKLYIIDNFYKNPDAVRKLALRAPYEDVTNLNYPGDQSKFAYTSNGVKEKFESIIRCSIETDESTMTFGKFRIMRDDERSWLKVHVDGISDWTAVIYLNPNESCQGGTAFYQHKETHLEGPPSFNELSRMGFNAYAEF